MSAEKWLPVVGYEGFYEVSDQGRVKRINIGRDSTEKLLKATVNKLGYLLVSLYRDGKGNTRRVHRLVLEAFTGPCLAGEEGCHNDGDPANNRLDNLRWGTASSNALDRVVHGTHNMSRKTHCSRGHELVEPNLVPSELARGKRTCRACKRAHHAARSPEVELTQELADMFHDEVMDGAWVSIRRRRKAGPWLPVPGPVRVSDSPVRDSDSEESEGKA